MSGAPGIWTAVISVGGAFTLQLALFAAWLIRKFAQLEARLNGLPERVRTLELKEAQREGREAQLAETGD